jgi:hypothetical protein
LYNPNRVDFLQGPEGKPNYISRILEFFETVTGERYCRVQWFFRAEDTVSYVALLFDGELYMS